MAEREDFFEAIFPDLGDTEFIEVKFIEPGSRKMEMARFAKNLDQLEQILNMDDGSCHVYYSMATRKRERGRKEDVLRTKVLWADLDDDKYDTHAESYKAIDRFILPPSMIVDTGYGYHTYWLLSEWVEPDYAEIALKAIQSRLSSDAVCDASRVFRVPGSYNVKRGAKVPCTLLRSRYDLRYNVDDIIAAAKVTEKFLRIIMTGGTQGYPSRSERDWAVAVALFQHGMSAQGVTEVFQERPVGDKYRGDTGGDSYLNLTLANAKTASKVKGKKKRAPRLAPGPFDVRNDAYYLGDSKVSTFAIVPRRLFVSDNDKIPDVFITDILASGHKPWRNIAIPKGAFHRSTDLMRVLGSVYMQWLGSDRQLRLLLPHLVKEWEAAGYPTAKMTSTLGRHADLWVSEKMVLSAETEMDALTAPIVYISSGRSSLPTSYDTTIPEEKYQALVEKIARLLHLINEPKVIWPIIGWFFAAPFKPILNMSQIRYPILNLHGIMGSGKTSILLKVMMPLAGYTSPYSHDCNTTHFVLMALMSSTNAIPIYLTEFRRATLSDREHSTLKRMFLQTYDVGHDSRGRADQTTVDYELSAPLILDGEDAMTDPAILERSVVVTMDPRTVARETEPFDTFEELSAEPDLHLFAGKYVQSTLSWDAKRVLKDWEECIEEVSKAIPSEIPDRPRRNMATLRFGIRRYVEFMRSRGIEMEMPPVKPLKENLESVINVAMGRVEMAVDRFVTDVIIEIALHTLIHPFIYIYKQNTNILWIHLTSSYAWWIRKMRMEGRESITSAALKAQLRARGEKHGRGPSQYVTGPNAIHTATRTQHMYGLLLDRCANCGLDVPTNVRATVFSGMTIEEIEEMPINDNS